MSEWRPFGGLECLLAALVLLTAAGARIWYLHTCAQDGSTDGVLQVQGSSRDSEWSRLVVNVRADLGYAVGDPAAPIPVAHPAPLYPACYSCVLRLFKTIAPIVPDSAAADHCTRWIQCGLGTFTALLIFLFTRQAFQSNVVATLAGLMAALHPFWIANTAEIADGILATCLLTICLYLGARAHRLRGALTSWAFGLALAGLALTRAALLLFAVAVLLWFLQRCTMLDRGWLLALVSCLGFVTGLGPWMVRNYLAFHEVYPIVDDAVYHFWLGNGPPEKESPDAVQNTDATHLQEVWQEVRLHPASTLQRRLEAGLNFLFGADWFEDARLCIADEDAERWALIPDWLSRSYRSMFAGSLLVLFLLSGLGWRVTYPWRAESMPLALALVWIPLPYLLSHAEGLSGPRLPWDAVLICFAAYATIWLLASAAHLVRGREFGVDVER